MGLRRAQSGHTLLEIMIALVVLSVAIVGTFSMMIAIRGQGDTVDDERQSTKLCQMLMERVISEGNDGRTPDAWRTSWNGRTFSLAELEQIAGPRAAGARPGLVTIEPVADALFAADTLYEIRVVLDTTGVSPRPVRVTLVTRKSFPTRS